MIKNKKQKNIPRGWKSARVEDIFEYISTYSHSKAQMSYEIGNDDSVYNIHYGDIHSKYSKYIDLSKNNVPFLIDESEMFRKEKFLNIGDLVMVDASEDYDGVGSSVEIRDLANKKCVAGLHTFVLRDKTKSTVDGYRALLFRNEKVHNWLKRISVYSKVFGITKTSLQKTRFLLPPLPEQKQIVKTLEIWDKCLEKLLRKIELKKDIKKGLMQRLLSGDVRLSGFSGEWKEFKLFQIGEVRTSSVDKKNVSGEKKVKLLNYMDVYRRDHIFQKDNFQEVTAKDSQVLSSNLMQGDVLFTPSSETQIDIGHSAVVMEDLNNVLFSYHIFRFRPKNKILNYNFSAYAFKNNKFYRELWKKSQGATRYTLSKDAIGKSKIIIPVELEEQTAISKILTTVDQEIEFLEKKKKMIEDQKKYLLNNLVTGKIRI